MKPKNDIYNHNHRLESVKKWLETASISNTNRKYIEQFDRICFMEGLGKPRRIKIIGYLMILAKDYLVLPTKVWE